MPALTRSRGSNESHSANSKLESSESKNIEERSPKSQSKKRTSSPSRQPSGRRRSKERSRSRSRGESERSKPNPDLSGKGKSVSRQKTPPRPNSAVITPTRTSSRLQRKKEEEETFSATKVMKDSGKPIDVPKTKEYSFGGPLGSLALMGGLPLMTYVINFVCLDEKRDLFAPSTWFVGLRAVDCFDRNTTLIFLGWFIFQAILAALPIGGKQALGMPLHGSGKRLPYNCNGFFALIVTLVVLTCGAAWDLTKGNGRLDWLTYVVDHFYHLMTAATAFSVILSIFLYIKALQAPKHALAPEGNSGCIPYDFFMGHELNPRIGSFDLKFFCEFRPGLIGWVVLDVAMCVKHWQIHNQVHPAMVIVTLFHLLYVGDAMYFEESILSTMDIIHEGFGFMLVYGDLVWVPFIYTLTTQFLIHSPQPMGVSSTIQLTAAILVCLIGYWIFRGSNSQKDQFRRDPKHPSVSALDSIPTASGRRLLAGGWWGIVRHPNYLGDIVMSIGWSLPCGFRSTLPWFYPVYLSALLIGRELRDEEACVRKHGHGWRKYQELVPYRIFPRVF